MENLSVYIYIIFGFTTLGTFWFLYIAAKRSNALAAILVFWLVLQGIIARSGFYLVTDVLPPRFLLLVFPPLLTILFLFATSRGRKRLDQCDSKLLTYLHSMRLPVEIVLWMLFVNKFVPQVMTFEGRNFDIFSGISAPLIAFFGYTRQKLGKWFLLIWNFICLILLLNIVIIAILAAPFPFQQLGFDQPNTGVLYFPFIWLPSFIVPAVLFSHLVCIRKLLIKP